MAQSTDLYPILKAYANKNNSPYIEIDVFLGFLKNYSGRKAPEQPEWAKWTKETGLKFWSEMSGLVESEKCILLSDTAEGRIYMPHYYAEALQEAYRSIDNTADMPFPDEESLRITIPQDQLKFVNLGSDFAPYFEKPDTEVLPIIKMIFPDGYGSALVLSPMIPRRLMEASLLKVRNYLRSHGNKEYALHKLTPQLQGKEKYLREILEQILIRPLDLITAMEAFGDFSYLFWAYFCALVKNDIKKKKEILAEDLAAIQAVYVIEVCNGFYKARAVKQRERELAFKALEFHMEQPPCHYAMDQIIKFTNNKGVPLIGLYSMEDLEKYVVKRTTESMDSELPAWLVFPGTKEMRWYIRKDKLLSLCAKLLVDTRPVIKKSITKRWMKLLREFWSEPAMEKDAEFDNLLTIYTKAKAPLLTSLLKSEKLLWVYEEASHNQGAIPPSSRIFKDGRLIPMSALYTISRKDILTDAKILLPFWYSVPVLTAIIAFFYNLGKKKKRKQQAGREIIVEEEAEEGEAKDIRHAAREIEASLVPPGQTLDAYLTDLETRWSRLLDKNARKNLVEDVNSLVRDHLRRVIRVQKNRRITRESLSDMATGLVTHTPALQKLSGQESLHLYMELYMVKLLLNIKM
ncbi:MAG: hypothetical protein LBN21_02785 [Treponema sp.]|jgi:hypothetical protein|nr:hypothetical protein [Treponema sp.]